VSDDAVSSSKAISGQVLAASLSAGEIVTAARFQNPKDAGLAYSVPNGFVAVSIPSDAVKGVAGLLKPGDFVMVTATFEPGPNGVDALTRVLLPKARVLAVGTDVGAQQVTQSGGSSITGNTANAETEQKAAPTVTLALAPSDVEKLVFAEEQGSVWLALLPATETEVPVTPGRTIQALFD
jgi:pilus assembly protein CpaB